MLKKINKILYLNTEREIGGGEMSLLNLLIGLKKYHYEVTVACPPGAFLKKLKAHNVNVIPIKIHSLKPIRIKFGKGRFYLLNPVAILHNLLQLISGGIQLHKIIKDISPQIIHANTPAAMAFVVLPAVIFSLPIIWHMRVLPQEKSPTEKLYIKLLSKFTKKIIAVSRAVKDRLICLGVISNKIEVAYNPIDADIFSPQNKAISRRKLQLPVHAIIVGSIGRLYRGKGYEVFLKAAAIIKRKHPNIYYLIAGNEWEKNYRRKLNNLCRQLGLSSNVIFMDWQQDARSLISSLDLLLLIPTNYEGFPRTLAEGMACEIPVVGSRVGGINELIDDRQNGLLVNPDDEKSTAEAIGTLVGNKQLSKKLAKHGRQKVKQQFTIEQHVEKIRKIYSNIVQISY